MFCNATGSLEVEACLIAEINVNIRCPSRWQLVSSTKGMAGGLSRAGFGPLQNTTCKPPLVRKNNVWGDEMCSSCVLD
jgi:hypothetical protein